MYLLTPAPAPNCSRKEAKITQQQSADHRRIAIGVLCSPSNHRSPLSRLYSRKYHRTHRALSRLRWNVAQSRCCYFKMTHHDYPLLTRDHQAGRFANGQRRLENISANPQILTIRALATKQPHRSRHILSQNLITSGKATRRSLN